jgi:hypothetical protein
VTGYLPLSGELSLDDVAEIERERSRLITRRLILAWIG